MGHQFSGNHPFNGNQLNCSGGNRSAATSVEPGSGSSIMAYAGICLTDDLQPHSDPYFSQRSLQEISTYTSSTQAAINEVQTASLRHFGGGNEVQVVTFGPGYSAAHDDPAAHVDDQRGAERDVARRRRGERQHRHDRDRRPTAHAPARRLGHDLGRRGRRLQRHLHGHGRPDHARRSSTRTRSPVCRYPAAARSRSPRPARAESGPPSTIRTTAAHNRSVGDVVTITGVGVAGYNGTFTITAVPTPRTSSTRPATRRSRQLGRRHGRRTSRRSRSGSAATTPP